jgi:foldase protein PrsA
MKYPKVILIILSFLIALNFSACTNKGKDQNFDPSDDCVATVGKLNIGIPEFKFYLKCIKSDMEKEAGIDSSNTNSVQTFWKLKINGVDRIETAKNKALETLEEIKVLLLRAEEEKIQLEQSDLDKVKSHIENTIKQEGGGDRAKAEKSINEKYGISLSEYEAIYKDYVLAYDRYSTAC